MVQPSSTRLPIITALLTQAEDRVLPGTLQFLRRVTPGLTRPHECIRRNSSASSTGEQSWLRPVVFLPVTPLVLALLPALPVSGQSLASRRGHHVHRGYVVVGVVGTPCPWAGTRADGRRGVALFLEEGLAVREWMWDGDRCWRHASSIQNPLAREFLEEQPPVRVRVVPRPPLRMGTSLAQLNSTSLPRPSLGALKRLPRCHPSGDVSARDARGQPIIAPAAKAYVALAFARAAQREQRLESTGDGLGAARPRGSTAEPGVAARCPG
ncbi:hypothetical protein JB92DRAFT_3102944 [Gautieria morchelliformis]|nr:hypothetical protein JB92DRAFT_3102944 [Gautieria morchelliformis]